MTEVGRAKRVTGPLGDEVRACLCGEGCRRSGGGSDLEAEDSSSLSDLVHEFLEDDAGSQTTENEEDSEGDGEYEFDPADALLLLLHPEEEDRFSLKVLSRVSKAVELFSRLRSSRSAFRWAVIRYLRDSGYNAAMCTTNWKSSGGLTGGSHEFIDVVRSGAGWSHRYIVDVDFAAEFEVARPTAQYARLLQILPRTYVGRPEELMQIVRTMADAAKRSLKSGDLFLPPWRRSRYMQAKWLGPYRRAVAPGPAMPPSPSSNCERLSIECRPTGFDNFVGSGLLLQPATRTR